MDVRTLAHGVKVPGLRVIRNYERAFAVPDAVAGLTVAAYLIPQCMAYGTLAGVGPMAGLWAALVPAVAYATFGTSKHLSAGPETTLSLMTAVVVGPMAHGDPTRYASLAAGLALIVGIIGVVAAAVNLGFLSDLLSKPVLVGYLAGVALLMFGAQLERITGVPIESRSLVGQIREFGAHVGNINWSTFVLAVGVFVFLAACERWVPRFPAPLVSVLVAAAIVAVWSLETDGVAVVGSVPSSLIRLSWPAVHMADLRSLLPAGLGFALVGYTDNILTARAFADAGDEPIGANQELFALGATNLAAAVSSGFPVSSSGTRTALAKLAGAKTQACGVVTVSVVVLALTFGRRVIELFPVAALGALVVHAALGLIDLGAFRRLLRFRWTEFALALVTIAGVVLLDVLNGIAVAVFLSAAALLAREARPHSAVLGKVNGLQGMHDISDWPDTETIDGLVVFRFDAPLFFANAGEFRTALLAAVSSARAPVEWVVLNAEAIVDIDATAVEMLGQVADELRDAGVTFALARAKQELWRWLVRSDLAERFEPDLVFATLPTALDAFEQRPARAR